MQQAAFDALTEDFNATVGKEQGIYVKGYSQGSVSDLEKAITDSADGVVGAEKNAGYFFPLMQISLIQLRRKSDLQI